MADADRAPAFVTSSVPTDVDVLAPDGSEIRLLGSLQGASSVHCRLPAGATSQALRHRTVEEVWWHVSGRGEVWRRQAGREEIVEFGPGTLLTIPLGTEFQFRAIGDAPLEFVITTVPAWPGEDEAVFVKGPW